MEVELKLTIWWICFYKTGGQKIGISNLADVKFEKNWMHICIYSGFLLERNFVLNACSYLIFYAIVLSCNCLSCYARDAGFSHMYTESRKQHLLCSV